MQQSLQLTLCSSLQETGAVLPRRMQVGVANSKRLVGSNSVLGFSPRLDRKKYAVTPIMQAMHECKGKGAVSVAWVPPALGKTVLSTSQPRPPFEESQFDGNKGISICYRNASTFGFKYLKPTPWLAVMPYRCSAVS